MPRPARALATALVLAVGTLGAPEPGLGDAERADETSQTSDPWLRGVSASARGRFGEAAEAFAAAAAARARSGDAAGRVQALLRLAEAQQALGAHRDAARSLEDALPVAEGLGDPARTAAVLGALGSARLALDRPEEAAGLLERALALARQGEDGRLEAALRNNLGNLAARRGDYAAAAEAYAESARQAEKTEQEELVVRALTNAARARLLAGEAGKARGLAQRAAKSAQTLPESNSSAFLRIGLARVYERLVPGDPALRLGAHALLLGALGMADRLEDPLAASYALGYLGGLYEAEGRHEEALDLTRRALRRTEGLEAPEARYLWEWQSARLLEASGHPTEAIAAYQRAVGILERLRPELTRAADGSGASFRNSVAPVYFGLVDVLLRRASAAADPSQARALRVRARDTVELLKAAELRDYFRDDCVDALQQKVRGVEGVSLQAAVVYPIPLPDRIELLLSLPGGSLEQFSVPVSEERLRQEVRDFRRFLERPTTRQYLPHARRLYDWLIRPLEPRLAVETLVFVPDGPLRTIPMSALHDGERFLIERHSVAITPGVELTDPRPLDRAALEPLLSGLSEPVEDFPPLAHVPAELGTIRELLGGEVLLDEAFRRDQVRERLDEPRFSVVHVATHGEFRGDFAESFLLTWDGRLTGDELADTIGAFRFRERPLELLTLSACETARGDERAALGLSGIAVKAGARSAIGTLWKVNDVAASQLMIEFYRQLAQEGVSRAAALQRAQRALLADPRYAHPGFWAAFLMISSWL